MSFFIVFFVDQDGAQLSRQFDISDWRPKKRLLFLTFQGLQKNPCLLLNTDFDPLKSILLPPCRKSIREAYTGSRWLQTSRLRDLETSRFRDFETSRLRDFEINVEWAEEVPNVVETLKRRENLGPVDKNVDVAAPWTILGQKNNKEWRKLKNALLCR